MTQDDIIKLMQQACDPDKKPAWHNGFWTITQEELERFVALVAEVDKKDADCYRWLKDNNASFSWNPSKYNQETISGFAAFGTGYCGFEFEAAIDKAMGNK